MSTEGTPKRRSNSTNGGIPRSHCIIEGCNNPTMAGRTRCQFHYREYERDRKRARVQAKTNPAPAVGLKRLEGKPDMIVVVYDDNGLMAGAYLYAPIRKLSAFECTNTYATSRRIARLADGTLVLTAKEIKKKRG